MDPARRTIPLRRLLEARLRPVDAEPWPRLRRKDPTAAWAGRIALDRARVAARPEDADAWWRLGVGLHALGRHDHASAAFLRAFRRDASTGETPQILLVTDAVDELDRALEVAREARGVELLWVCTRPIVFDAAHVEFERLAGRVYRVDAAYLEPFLRDVDLPGLTVALARNARTIAAVPRRVRRVRLPEAWIEDAPGDAAGFDALLCPSRVSAQRWAEVDGPEIRPVIWPAPAPPEHAADHPALVFALAAGTPAWTGDTLLEALRVSVTEMPEVDVVLWPDRARRADALAVWNRWRAAAPSEEVRGRVRVALGASTVPTANPRTLLVCEPTLEAWARHLRRGCAVLVLDPGGRDGDGALPTARSALQVVEHAHAVQHEPAAYAATAEAVFRSVSFAGGAAPRLSQVLATLASRVASPGGDPARRAAAD